MSNKFNIWMKTSMAIVALSLVAMSGTPAMADSQKFSVDLKDAPLIDAVLMLTQQTGVQFIIADRDKPFSLITLSLRNSTPEQAIQKICMAAGGYAETDASGVYIIRFGEKQIVKPVENARVAVKEPLTITKLRCRRADAFEVLQQITGQFAFDPMSGVKEISQMRASWTTSSRANDDYLQGKIGVSNMAKTAPQRGLEAAEASQSIFIPGEGSKQGGGFPGGGGNQGGGLGGGGGAGGAGGAGGGSLQIQPGNGLVPNGIEYLAYDPVDGSIVVQGTDDAIRRLRQIIDLFDVAPKQVEVKVEFITVTQSLSKSFGIDWTFSRGSVFTGVQPGSYARAGDPVFINYSTGNLVTRLRAQLLEGEGKVVTAPIVRTMNNQLAQVSSQITTNYFVPVTTFGAGGNQTTFNPQQININTGISVRPRIMDNNVVAMTLFPVVSDLGQLRRAPDGTTIPDTTTQSVQVAIRVRSGDTVVLGGLNRTQNLGTTNRYPILSDLPLIGSLFRSTTRERNDQELLIFVTPTVIVEDDGEFIAP